MGSRKTRMLNVWLQVRKTLIFVDDARLGIETPKGGEDGKDDRGSEGGRCQRAARRWASCEKKNCEERTSSRHCGCSGTRNGRYCRLRGRLRAELPEEDADGSGSYPQVQHESHKSCARLAGSMCETTKAVAQDCVPTAAETRTNCRRIVAGGGVQRSRWQRKICGHKVPGACTPQIEGTSGVTATDRVPVACTPRIGCTSGVTATELWCSGVIATETECSGVTATGEVRW